MKILIVDDEPFNCFALQSLLSSLKLFNLDNAVDYVYSGEDYINHVQDSIIEIPATTQPECLSVHEAWEEV